MYAIQLKNEDTIRYISNLSSQDVCITDNLDEAEFKKEMHSWRLDRYSQLLDFGIEASWVEVMVSTKIV